MKERPHDIDGHAILRISSTRLSRVAIKERLKKLPLQDDGDDLILSLPSQTEGVNCTLITMWQSIQHDKHHIKNLIQDEVDIRVICIIDKSIRDLILEPDALLLPTKLGIRMEFKTKRK